MVLLKNIANHSTWVFKELSKIGLSFSLVAAVSCCVVAAAVVWETPPAPTTTTTGLSFVLPDLLVSSAPELPASQLSEFLSDNEYALVLFVRAGGRGADARSDRAIARLENTEDDGKMGSVPIVRCGGGEFFSLIQTGERKGDLNFVRSWN